MLESCSAVPWSLKLIERLSAQELLLVKVSPLSAERS
jgi:hypothetical protein